MASTCNLHHQSPGRPVAVICLTIFRFSCSGPPPLALGPEAVHRALWMQLTDHHIWLLLPPVTEFALLSPSLVQNLFTRSKGPLLYSSHTTFYSCLQLVEDCQILSCKHSVTVHDTYSSIPSTLRCGGSTSSSQHTVEAKIISPPGIMEHFPKFLPNVCSIDET